MLTILDEAIPMIEATSEACCHAFLHAWVARYGLPMERPQLHPEHQGSLCPVLPSSHKWNCRKSALFHQKRLKGHADGYGSGVQTRLVSPLTLGPPFTKGGPHPQDRCQFSQTTPRPKPYSARSVGGSPHPAHVGRGPQGPGEPSRSQSQSGDCSNVLTLEGKKIGNLTNP